MLLVDDEPEVRAVYGQALRRALPDVTVLEAASADEARRRLADGGIDLLLSDERLPDGRGVDVIAQARREHPEVVGILLTGHADASVIRRAAADAGVVRLQEKPWSVFEAVRVIEDLLDKKRLRDQLHELERAHAEERPRQRHGPPAGGPRRRAPDPNAAGRLA